MNEFDRLRAATGLKHRPKRKEDQEPFYRCKGCRLWYPWSFGCADDMPDHCDICWCEAHQEVMPAGTATPETYKT